MVFSAVNATAMSAWENVEVSNLAVHALREAWRTTVPGGHAQIIATDVASDSLMISDGWGVPFAALRLHLLSVRTGEERGSVRTRHQAVGAIAVVAEFTWVATSTRLLQARTGDLSIVSEWERGLIAHAHSLVSAAEGRLVMSNWLAPTIGVFEPATGTTSRRKAGAQPVVFRDGDDCLVGSGFGTGLKRLDPTSAHLTTSHEAAPSITAGASIDGIWGVIAGPPVGGEGSPPVWTKAGTSGLRRITAESVSVDLSGGCLALFPDVNRHHLWCLTGETASRLERIDTSTGLHAGIFAAQVGHRLRHVEPAAGMAFALQSNADGTSALIAYILPGA